MTTLQLENLVKTYYRRTVVNSVSLSVESGSVVGLLGPNGAGKTTTFYMTVGMIRPDAGRVLLGGEEISDTPMFVRARKGIGYLPQEASIFRKLTVRQNVMAVLETMSLTRSDRERRADLLLEELGIKRLSDQKANVLSGGERRRLEISRALATNPAFMLLDEPFAGIDPLAVVDIRKIIEHLKKRDIGILISDHNVRETLEVCNRAYILNNGQVIEFGSPEKIAASETARRFYLGEEFRL
ncbi:Lipopolysaccharide ABC transporter, ATP-binding protein LptB [Olavius algarvensis associated proteobacterium Delta 3]|nr:Lipopolysaccharide ABC transporter, ATP-binding protein LptB [Olavius algarvensis associated proteobacterium Delta 3]CAB5119673.1 Lipopolysaccharide ABC transporter, ATP-binding protein LptB [Olavius algarvensis associated proteobacterium Delta 3]